ncbi:MAG: hypothetical protein JO000_31150 [Alphaproteobacteria bacterium]|nr:hypothetical protein [Alphaproteobacteria bacterium]
MSATTGNEPFREIEVQIASRERRTLAITAIISAGIILGAIALLAVTYWTLSDLNAQLSAAQQRLEMVRTDLEGSQAKLAQVDAARKESEASYGQVKAALAAAETQLAQQRQEAERLRAQLADSNSKLEALTAQIRESADLTRYLHPIDFADAKNLYNTAPQLGDLLARILSLKDRNLPFNFANRPDVGFTSPGFAGYVLQELRRLPAGAPDAALRTLPSATEPQLGDVILYETGFALFYLKDHNGAPFVIGMTPKGVAALDPDFRVRRTGVLRTDLGRR